MTISILSPVAKEGGTYVVTATFYDEDDALVVPTTITWTLKDSGGSVVNSRQDVSVSPASSIYITLTGSDLPVNSHPQEELILTVNAVYNSSYGTDLTLVNQCKITVEAIG